MLTSRKEADELGKQYNLTASPSSAAASQTGDSSSGSDGAAADGSSAAGGSASQSLPDIVILKMLKREALLTSAKLHALTSDLLTCQRTISRLRSSIRHVRRGGGLRGSSIRHVRRGGAHPYAM
jgi:hypothetical protein